MLSLGPLARCRVWHDNKGFGAAWHLDYIEVQEVKTLRKWKFNCNKWLSLSEDDKQISRDLVCEQAAGEEAEEKSGRTTYEFKIITGSKRNAGMLHDAWIILEGKQDSSRVFTFNNSAQERIFVSGTEKTFTYTSKSLGPLQCLFIGAMERKDMPLGDVRGRDADWHCYKVIVTDTKSGTKYHFKVDDWISIQPTVKRNRAKEVELEKVEEDPSKQMVKKIRSESDVF